MSFTNKNGENASAVCFYQQAPSPFLIDWEALGPAEQGKYERWFMSSIPENCRKLECLVQTWDPRWAANASAASLEPLGEWLEQYARVRPFDDAVDGARTSAYTFALAAIQLEDRQGANVVMTDETLLAVSLAAVYVGETYRRMLVAKGQRTRWQRAKRRSSLSFGQIVVWCRGKAMSGETDWGDVLLWALRYYIQDNERRLALESSVASAVDLMSLDPSTPG